jgi:alkylation response protein AidB-like acyl-CoA dehydrogenase
MIERSLFCEEEHELFRESVKQFIAEEIVPYHEAWEEAGCVPRELWNKAGEMGLLCPDAPEEYGGPGGNFLFNVIVSEELTKTGATGPGFPLQSDIVLPYLVNYGSEAQKQHWIPRMVSGEVVTAIAMSEPDAGSDLQGITTTAVKDGDSYVINGSKTFVTNGQLCDLVILVAKTDRAARAHGTSLFLMEANREGFSRGRNLKKVGLKAQDTSELFLDDVRVPSSALLGQENLGFHYLMQQLPQERLSVAVFAVASAAAALDWTLTYTKERKAFGKPVAKFQNTRFKLAELAAEIQIGQVFVDRCIELHLTGKLDVATAAMAKLWTTEMQWKVIDNCVQFFGGYGYMLEYPIARAWTDARVQRVYAGTSEIMKEIIARSLI